MIDLYTALKLFKHSDCFMLFGTEYSRKEILEKFDTRKIKVTEIYLDLWNDCIGFKAERTN